MPKSLHVARIVLSGRLKTIPFVFRAIARFREDGERTLIRADSDLAIEGFWRCANHYATYAFIVAQPRPVHVARRFHAPAQLMLAVRWNVPALLLIREPVAAVSSTTVFLEYDDPLPLLKFYNIFYSALVPYRDRLIISDFDRTTHDFGSVIAEINERYGRDYALYRGTPEEERRVEELIRAGHNANPRATVARLPLPAQEKERLKDKVMEKLLDPRCASLLTRSRDLYETFLRAQHGG